MDAEIVEPKFGGVPFSYAVLRYAPDPSCQDFVRVGVALHAPQAGFLGMRAAEVAAHVRDLLPLADPDVLRRDLDAIEASLTGIDPECIANGDLAILVHSVLPAGPSRYRWSETSSGITDDPRVELNTICDRECLSMRFPLITNRSSR